ncbi:MAG: hypothetical protein GY845_21415 [Planctomycetes bacterium]|nr:hypothetical protein [Planctomycetota bacterium]
MLAHLLVYRGLYAIFPSTTVENVRQITPYLKKQTQFSPFFTQIRGFHKKQSQFNPILPAIASAVTLFIDGCHNPAYNDPGNF